MVSVGTSRVAGSQAFRVKKGQRFITNPNTASMGFCLPAATGICVAQPGKPVVCVTGEGSLQMNLQELQTIWQNRLPVKLFVINNQGYHSIRQTQQSYFEPPLVGVGAESGDLSFPDLSKIIPAYGFSYRAVHAAEELPETLHQVLEETGGICVRGVCDKISENRTKNLCKKTSGWKYGIGTAGRYVSFPQQRRTGRKYVYRNEWRNAMKRIIVTGATSMIGTALIEECIRHDIEVYAVVRAGSSKTKRLPESARIHQIECELEN